MTRVYEPPTVERRRHRKTPPPPPPMERAPKHRKEPTKMERVRTVAIGFWTGLWTLAVLMILVTLVIVLVHPELGR